MENGIGLYGMYSDDDHPPNPDRPAKCARILVSGIFSRNEVSIEEGSKTSGRILVRVQSSLGEKEVGTNLQCCRDILFVGDQAAIWQRLLTCSLLPLRHCLDTVRREFARLCCSLMEEYLDPDLLDHLAGIAQEVRINRSIPNKWRRVILTTVI